MFAPIQIAVLSERNIDSAVALLCTVVPPRPSLRAALLGREGQGFVVTEAGRPVLAVGMTSVDGETPATWVRIASVRPRDTRRWLEALPLASSALCKSSSPIECTVADWESGAADHLATLGLGLSGRAIYMTSRERHELPQVELASPSDEVIRACFEIDRAAEHKNQELRSSEAEAEAEGDEDQSYRQFARAIRRFLESDDFFVFRIGSTLSGYLLLDENAIDTVVVRPNLQRRGIGSMIVRFACATLRQRGHDIVSLLTADTNIDAVRLYERHGFRLHSVTRWFRPMAELDNR
jgi:ribosomal protein S18 acetylase RimI-like enzyme